MKHLLLTVLAFTFFLTCLSQIHAAEPAFGRRPNIILIITDDQGYYDLSCHGNPKEHDQLHGRSLVPLLKNANAPWEDRFRVFHKGRWRKGQAANSRDKGFAVRNQRFRLVGRNALYDMEKDPSQKTNVIADHPEIAKKMNAVYDKWFDGALPNMVNEDAPLTGHNTFHLMFWKQYDMEIPPVKKRKPRASRKKKPGRR